MTTATDLVSELIRTANRVERLSPEQVRQLLDRAVHWIDEIRRQVGIVPIQEKDALKYLRTVSAGADRVPPEEWHHALLHAAEMVRDLHIVTDTGTAFRLVPK